MKSASRGRRAADFPDDDGFGTMWPDSFGNTADAPQVDPWTNPNVLAQAFGATAPTGSSSNQKQRSGRKSRRQEELDKIAWTATDLSGFPADPFVMAQQQQQSAAAAVVDNAWPSPQVHHRPHPAEQHQQHPMRMSDEDWLPATTAAQRPVVSSEVASTWGSVAQGRSEESDDWHTDPLSQSQDGFSQPPLGTETRPIAVEDLVQEELEMEEREADLLQQAQRKQRYNDEPARLVPQQRSGRKSPTKARSPIPEELSEDVSPRKGIMRFFGGGVSEKRRVVSCKTSARLWTRSHNSFLFFLPWPRSFR